MLKKDFKDDEDSPKKETKLNNVHSTNTIINQSVSPIDWASEQTELNYESFIQAKDAGNSYEILKYKGFNINYFIDVGVIEISQLLALNFSLREIKSASYRSKENIGIPYFSVSDFLRVHCNLVELFSLFGLKELMLANITMKQIVDLIEQTDLNLKELIYVIKQFKQEGINKINLQDLVSHFKLSDLRLSGITAKELFDETKCELIDLVNEGKYTLKELIEVRILQHPLNRSLNENVYYSLSDLREYGGFELKEFLLIFHVSSLKLAGFKWYHFISQGITINDLVKNGFLENDLKNLGFSPIQIKKSRILPPSCIIHQQRNCLSVNDSLFDYTSL